jgi:hypothetical protein
MDTKPQLIIKSPENRTYSIPASMKNRLTALLAASLLAGMAQAQPTITQQPTNQVVTNGGIATFNVALSGTGPFTYQWQFNGTNLPNGIIRTVAGNGLYDYSGDGGPATNAKLNYPYGVAVDASGNLFIADYGNNRIRKVNTNGIITTVAGNGQYGYSGDGGTATNAELEHPMSVVIDHWDNLFIVDADDLYVRKVNTNGIITTVAGNGQYGDSGDGGPATNATFGSLTSVAVDTYGNLFLADYYDQLIRKIDTNGIIRTVAGNGGLGYSGDGGPATNAELFYPGDVTVDSAGNLFIADGSNHIRKVDTNGIIRTVAGNGGWGYSGDDGVATNAALNLPTSVRADAYGNLFIADDDNSRIREVMGINGIITTVAGNGVPGYSGDGGLATSAELKYPFGVAVDNAGNVFIADEFNSRIREVTGIPPYPTTLPTFLIGNVSSANAGNYSVVISGSGGSITSSVVSLMVAWPPVVSKMVKNTDGGLTLNLVTTTNVSSRVYAATNLVPPVVWQPVYTNLNGGAWQFTDTNTSGITSKYYRLSTP